MILDKKNQNKNIGKVDFGVLYTILILLAIGVVMIYSASSFYSMFHYNDSMFYLKKQGIMAVIGLVAMFFMMNFDYHRLKKITPKLLIITIPLLITFCICAENSLYTSLRSNLLSISSSLILL